MNVSYATRTENRKILKYQVWKYLFNNGISIDEYKNPFTFELCVKRSGDFGLGLFVNRGIVRKGDVCAIYPGSIFLPGEPLLSMF